MQAMTRTGTDPRVPREAPAPAAPPPPSWPPGVPRPRRVFAAGLALSVLLILCHNTGLFTRPVHEYEDFAANALLINRARKLELLVGNYSRVGFNHPGPAILYVQAGCEALLHDQLHIVPAPHNAHILGSLLLNAVLLALTLAILHAHFRSLLATAAAAAVFLHYFGHFAFTPPPADQWGHHLSVTNHWMPQVYFAPFLLLLAATASVAAGEGRHLPWLALAGGLLVHGHVCFAAFVVPLALYALIALAAAHGLSPRRLLRCHGPALAGFAALVAAFLLPIGLNMLWHYPGEVGKYFAYVRGSGNHHPLGEVVPFLLTTLTSESAHPWPIALGVVAALALTWPRAAGPRRRYTAEALAACALAAAATFYYATRGVDSLEFTYTCIFFGSVLLLPATLAAMNAVELLGTSRPRRVALGSLASAAGLAAALTGHFTNDYPGRPFLADLADRLAAEGADGPVVVTHAMHYWPEAAGLVAQLERRGRRVFVAEPQLGFLYTPRFTAGWETLSGARRLDFALADEPSRRVRAVLYAEDRLSVRELDPWYRPGGAVTFTDGRDWEVFRGRGWERGGEHGARVLAPEARLRLPLREPLQGDALLSVTALSRAPAGGAGGCVSVEVNGRRVATWQLGGDRPADYRAPVPADALRGAGLVEITFRLPPGPGGAEVWLQKLSLTPCRPAEGR